MDSKTLLNSRVVWIVALVTCCGVWSAKGWSEIKVGTETGEMYPDFRLPTVDDKASRLSDYRGKKIMLFHFASW